MRAPLARLRERETQGLERRRSHNGDYGRLPGRFRVQLGKTYGTAPVDARRL